MTSGAIQNGVPTNVSLFLLVSVSWPATPKSASFTSPVSDRSTLAAASNQDRGNLILCKLIGVSSITQACVWYQHSESWRSLLICVKSILPGGRKKGVKVHAYYDTCTSCTLHGEAPQIKLRVSNLKCSTQ